MRKTVDAPPFLDEEDDEPPPKFAARSASPAAPAAPATVPMDPSEQEHLSPKVFVFFFWGFFYKFSLRLFKCIPVTMVARMVAAELRSEIAAAVEGEVRSAMSSTQKALKQQADTLHSFNF